MAGLLTLFPLYTFGYNCTPLFSRSVTSLRLFIAFPFQRIELFTDRVSKRGDLIVEFIEQLAIPQESTKVFNHVKSLLKLFVFVVDHGSALHKEEFIDRGDHETGHQDAERDRISRDYYIKIVCHLTTLSNPLSRSYQSFKKMSIEKCRK